MLAVERVGIVIARIWRCAHDVLKLLDLRNLLAGFHAHVFGHVALLAVSTRRRYHRRLFTPFSHREGYSWAQHMLRSSGNLAAGIAGLQIA